MSAEFGVKSLYKSLLTSLFQREAFPLFGKEGLGKICLLRTPNTLYSRFHS